MSRPTRDGGRRVWRGQARSCVCRGEMREGMAFFQRHSAEPETANSQGSASARLHSNEEDRRGRRGVI